MIRTRLFVGDIPLTCQSEDILELLAKLKLTVNEVYIPRKETPTGVTRYFAIATVEGQQDSLQNCLKKLNNCFWKGKKIRVEMAKEYYLDRLSNEREENRLTNTNSPHSQQIEPLNVFNDNTLSLRPYRGKELVTCHVIPNTPREVGMAGKRLVFEDRDGELQGVRYFNDAIVDETDLKNINLAVVAAPEVPAASSSTNKATLSQRPAKVGAGIRRGFGTLLTADPCSSCILPSNDHLDASAAMDVENVPCMLPGEITESSLRDERNRYISMLTIISAAAAAPNVTTEGIINFDSLGNSNQFANTTELKSIFHREGGVMWEHENLVKGAVVNDASLNDEIFLEAEKCGFDVRGTSSGAENVNPKSITFGFFADVVAAAPVEVAKEIKPAVKEGTAMTKARASPRLLSIEEILTKAQCFRGDKSKASLVEYWSSTREKFTVDFKRKRREAIKNSRKSTKRRK